MILKDESIRELLEHKHSIDFIRIKLIQNIPNKPRVYSGPGSISQDLDGSLNLKMYCKYKYAHKELSTIFNNITPGKILGKEYYYSLSASDMYGNKWTAKNISINGNIYLPTSARVIEAKIRSIVNIEEEATGSDKTRSRVYILVKGSYDFPFNKKENLPGGGWAYNTTEINNDRHNITITTKDSYSNINVDLPYKTFKDGLPYVLLESLSILTGKYMMPTVISCTHNNKITTTIFSEQYKLKDIRITSFLRHIGSRNIKAFQEFIEKYLDVFPKQNSDYFKFWLKIAIDYKFGIKNAALAVCVAIEGILKKYFVKNGFPDKEFKKQANEAIIILENLEISDRVKGRLGESIKLALNSNPKTALMNLSKKGLFDKKLVNIWVKLRNTSVHPSSYEDLHDEYQKYIYNTYACLQLFYCLMFIKIKYTNIYCDFTKEGWPDTIFGEKQLIE